MKIAGARRTAWAVVLVGSFVGAATGEECDLLPLLNRARDLRKRGEPVKALQVLADGADDDTLRRCYNEQQKLTQRDILAFFRERADTYLATKRRDRRERALADYGVYLDIYRPEDGIARKEGQVGPKGLKLDKPQSMATGGTETAWEYPRMVLNMYGNLCVELHRESDLLDTYEDMAGAPDLFDRSALQKWFDAVFLPAGTIRPGITSDSVDAFCKVLQDKKLRVSPRVKAHLSKRCPQ